MGACILCGRVLTASGCPDHGERGLTHTASEHPAIARAETAERQLAAVTAERDDIAAQLAVAREALQHTNSALSGSPYAWPEGEEREQYRRYGTPQESRVRRAGELVNNFLHSSPSPRADAMLRIVKAALNWNDMAQWHGSDKIREPHYIEAENELVDACDALEKLNAQ